MTDNTVKLDHMTHSSLGGRIIRLDGTGWGGVDRQRGVGRPVMTDNTVKLDHMTHSSLGGRVNGFLYKGSNK